MFRFTEGPRNMVEDRRLPVEISLMGHEHVTQCMAVVVMYLQLT